MGGWIHCPFLTGEDRHYSISGPSVTLGTHQFHEGWSLGTAFPAKNTVAGSVSHLVGLEPLRLEAWQRSKLALKLWSRKAFCRLNSMCVSSTVFRVSPTLQRILGVLPWCILFGLQSKFYAYRSVVVVSVNLILDMSLSIFIPLARRTCSFHILGFAGGSGWNGVGGARFISWQYACTWSICSSGALARMIGWSFVVTIC